MRSVRSLVLACSLLGTAALAQPPGGPRGPGGFIGGGDAMPGAIDRLTILLDLDTYQKNAVERVLTEQREAAVAARNELGAAGEQPSFEEMRALREQLRDETLTKLQAVLTEQQLAKFKVLTERPASRPASGAGDQPRI
jgi:hypothetical protein